MKKFIGSCCFIFIVAVFLSFPSAGFSFSPGTESPQEMRLTILFDNTARVEGGSPGWGFACLVEGAGKTILFDTGADEKILWKNAQVLKTDLTKADAVVISHTHPDHTAGLVSVLRKKKDLTVYCPERSGDAFVENIRKNGGKPEIVVKPVEISKDVFLIPQTGNGVDEVSLAMRTAKGLTLVTGCAHPGIVGILRKADDALKDKVSFVMGGFHLLDLSEEGIRNIISSFKEMGVRTCGATHCTGDLAIKLFKETFGGNYVSMGVGKVVIL